MKDKLIELFMSDKCPVFFTSSESKRTLAEYICNNLANDNLIDNWIYCDDRCVDNFPKDCSQVLVKRHNSELGFDSVMMDSYDGYGKWNEDENHNPRIWKVIAWQPLPK